MEKIAQRRKGKVASAGHSTVIDGLPGLIKRIEEWDEVSLIIPGRIKTGQGGRRRPGLNLRASREIVTNGTGTGVKCLATHGSANQEVILRGDPASICRRLEREGFATYTQP